MKKDFEREAKRRLQRKVLYGYCSGLLEKFASVNLLRVPLWSSSRKEMIKSVIFIVMYDLY